MPKFAQKRQFDIYIRKEKKIYIGYVFQGAPALTPVSCTQRQNRNFPELPKFAQKRQFDIYIRKEKKNYIGYVFQADRL